VMVKTHRPLARKASGHAEHRTGFANNDGAVSALDYTTAAPPGIPQSLCPRCAYCGPHHRRGGSQ
jgi:hypothetical protein